MASVSEYGAGHSVKFFWPPGFQRQCRLRGFDRAAADEAADHIEAVIRSTATRRPVAYATQRWLQNVAPANLIDALVKCGLHDDRRLLRDAAAAYIDHKWADVGAARLGDIDRILAGVVKFIGRKVSVADVTRDDVDRWADTVSELAESTQSKYAAIVRGFFSWCVFESLAVRSPADHLNVDTFAAESRREVSAAEFDRVAAAVDVPCYAALTLARYAGLRASEAAALRWDWIDTDAKRIDVRDTKRNRIRNVPIVPAMATAFDRVASHGGRIGFVCNDGDGAELTRSAIDKRIRAACDAAGVPLWPRLFHNLRATRQTDWIAEFGLVNACHWIGNSQTVAARHYAMERQSAFDAATQSTNNNQTETTQ